MPRRLYHPKTGHEIDWVPDHEDTINVFLERGWKIAPEPEEPEPGYAPEPVTYEPVAAKKAASKAKATEKTS